MFEEENQNYYDILDIKPDATLNDVRQAYFRTKQAYSKDSAALYSLFDDIQTKQVLERIEQAFLVLSNPEKRKEYDKVHGFLSPTLPHSGIDATGAKQKGGSFSFDTGLSLGANQNTPVTVGPVKTVADDLAKGIFSGLDEQDARNTAAKTTTENYATPRTLADSSLSESETEHPTFSTIPSWDEEVSWKSNQNRLGIVRRVDLIKTGEKDSSLEAAISEETEFSGEFLRKIRESRRISLDELSEFTKISKNYLQALESEDYDSLPAAVYTRGFVFQVAKSLKIPHEKASTGYMSRYNSKRK